MHFNTVIVHYAEIAIKGKNRPFFERALITNIHEALKDCGIQHIKRRYGRIVITLHDNADHARIVEQLNTVFGISSYAFATTTKSIIEDIQHTAHELIKELCTDKKSFRIKTKRPWKHFPLTSPELNKTIAHYITQQPGTNHLILDYVEAESTLFIEITESETYLYTHKHQGQRGLPIGVTGKVLSLLSGGIDSPVASILAMKRGCRPVYIHFESQPHTTPASIEKVKQLTRILSTYQGRTKLILIPFARIQQEIMMKTSKKLRVILYRRFMVRIAEEIAKQEKARALLTGENLAQVASQTLDNLSTIDRAATIPILRPLITYDKQETIDLAQKYGTYDTSIIPADDCCSLFLPSHPATTSTIREVEEEEHKLDVQALITDAIQRKQTPLIKE